MEFIFLIFGVSIGSFLNVLIDRIPANKSFIKGRSFCDYCHKTLNWYDLIPVFSFVMLSGKCRYCHTPLSYQYPLVEVLTGVLFVITFYFLMQGSIQNQVWSIQYGVGVIYHLFIVSVLISIFFIDIKYGIIPDKIVFPAIIISFLYLILNTPYVILPHALSAIGAFMLFLIIHLVTRGRGMGLGDVKYVILMGLVLGFPKIIPGLYLAFLTGAFISIILILTGQKKLRGDTIPFGPFLVLGTFVGLFFGKEIISYLFFYL